MSNDFWFNYPIFLPDYDQFNNQVDMQGQPDEGQYSAPADFVRQPQQFGVPIVDQPRYINEEQNPY